MKKSILISALALLLSAAPGFAQVEKILDEGINNNQTMNYLDVLSNRFGGRLLGSGAYEDAANWCEYMFKSWGVEVIRQECGELPVGFNRGPWFGKMIGGSGESLHFATPSYTAGTKGVQRGTVVKEPLTTADFEKMKGTMKGAWVLINGESSGFPIDFSASADSLRAIDIAYNDSLARASRGPRGGAAEGVKFRKTPALFYKQMVEAGILGIIQSSSDPIRALYDRKNLMNMTFETLPTIPDIKLDERQYKKIEEMVDHREYLLLEFDIRNHFRMGPVKYHNIIGVIRGSKYPNEYVMCGGHLDAYDVATGGVDCGSGATVALEAARLIAKTGVKPKRTILFCLWAGEEFGLWGSKYFVENCKYLDKISNYFNRDGGPTIPTGITVPEAMYDDFVNVCKPLQGKFDFEVRKRQGEPRPRPTSAGGSDHAYFAMNGVPTLGFDQGDPLGYNFNYGEIWHTDRDLYNKSIPEYQEACSTITAVTLWGLANLNH
ncbi:MAG: M20/M25/M40 family metallo-hydrolase, partial [Bacteroidales bacterium]|nr:M20/M25/M40 family metallo-hydrolase [Bacteroidales bacterium]